LSFCVLLILSSIGVLDVHDFTSLVLGVYIASCRFMTLSLFINWSYFRGIFPSAFCLLMWIWWKYFKSQYW
jgi:hypothetical protein